MQLSHYPAAIAQAAQRVSEIDSQIMAVQQLINREEGQADTRSAFDIDLKNDTQRKARRFEVLLINQEYQTAIGSASNLGGLGKVEGCLVPSKTYGMSALWSSQHS